MSISYPNFEDWRNQNHVFEKIGVFNRESYNLTGAGEAERILTAQASADLFSALRVNPVVGRLFTNEEDQPGGPPVVVLSYGLWQRRFGGQMSILNQSADSQRKELHRDWRHAPGIFLSQPRRDVGACRSTLRRSKLEGTRQSSRPLCRRAFEARRNSGASTGGHGKHCS